jgi:hypothetical protein
MRLVWPFRGAQARLASAGPSRFFDGVRGPAYAFSALVLAAVLGPGVVPGASDSFPLSTYPMFSYERPETAWMATARAVHADGRRAQVAAADIASSEPMQALVTLKRALDGGKGAARELCRQIAGRVGRDPEVEAVELGWEQYPVVGYFLGETEPRAVRRVIRCRP